MAIVAGFDVHRGQITFDALETETGEVSRGRIDATPAAVARWTKRFAGRELHVAVEACSKRPHLRRCRRSSASRWLVTSPVDERREDRLPAQALLVGLDALVALEEAAAPLGQAAIDLLSTPLFERRADPAAAG